MVEQSKNGKKENNSEKICAFCSLLNEKSIERFCNAKTNIKKPSNPQTAQIRRGRDWISGKWKIRWENTSPLKEIT